MDRTSALRGLSEEKVPVARQFLPYEKLNFSTLCTTIILGGREGRKRKGVKEGTEEMGQQEDQIVPHMKLNCKA